MDACSGFILPGDLAIQFTRFATAMYSTQDLYASAVCQLFLIIGILYYMEQRSLAKMTWKK